MTAIRTWATTVAMVAGLFLASLWSAESASAHVTVAAPGVTAGASDAGIVFRVPTESASASTVEVRIQLPVSTPLAGVLVAPIPGWAVTITNTTLPTPIKTDDGEITEVVSQIDWKADAAAAIKPGFVGQFPIVVGSLPTATTLTFKAIQTYSDKSQVAWIEVPAAGSTAAPEHPAPTLELAAAGGTGTPSAGTGASAGSAASSGTSASAGSAGRAATGASDATARTGIVLGALGLVLGAAALALTLLRARRERTSLR